VTRSTESPGGQRRWVLALAVGVYLFAFRIYDVENSFALLGEQVRDWSVAQRSLDNLPWIGPRSVTSGLDIGPFYYRFLWLARVLVGPFADNLPHAGAWAISALQSLGDVVLFIALSRVLENGWLAAAIVITGGSATLDAHLSSTIWNPPIAVAFVKLASAACIWSTPLSRRAGMCALGFAALAVQTHFSALVVAAPVTIAVLWALWRAQRLRGVAPAVVVGAVVMLSWLLPYFVSAPPELAASAVRHQPSGALSSLEYVVADPLSRFHVRDSVAAVAGALEFLLGRPYQTPWLRWALLGGMLILLACRHVALAAISVGAIAAAIAVFSLWQGSFGEVYWFLVIGPAGAICMLAPIALTRGRVRSVLTAAAVVLMTLMQPARAHEAWTEWRLPQYGVLVSGARAIVADGSEVREINAAFHVPDGMDVYFLHALLGGRLDPSGPVARIEQSGEVTYQP
jgi:hypothetical protein